MLARIIPRILAVIILLTLVPKVFAAKIIPCVVGSGSDNGCSLCEDSKAIDVVPWSSAKTISRFDMPKAASTIGGGYDVWWVSRISAPTLLYLSL